MKHKLMLTAITGAASAIWWRLGETNVTRQLRTGTSNEQITTARLIVRKPLGYTKRELRLAETVLGGPNLTSVR